MTPAEFRDLVAKMRLHQRAWFARHSPSDLRAAKDYERRVDAELDASDSRAPERLL